MGPCSGPGIPGDEVRELNDSSSRSFTLTGLRPNSQYSVMLEAINIEGSGTSDRVIISTKIEGITQLSIDYTCNYLLVHLL